MLPLFYFIGINILEYKIWSSIIYVGDINLPVHCSLYCLRKENFLF